MVRVLFITEKDNAHSHNLVARHTQPYILSVLLLQDIFLKISIVRLGNNFWNPYELLITRSYSDII